MPTAATSPRYPRVTSLVLALSAAVAFGGCGSRPLVIGNAHQLGDLYADGALTDTSGNRWDIGFMPGIAPTGHVIGDSYTRAWNVMAETGTYGADGRQSFTRRAWRFAFHDCIGHLIGTGIGKDYASTTRQMSELVHDMPFGWPLQMAYRPVWGYVLKPVCRITAGTVGAVAGIVAGTPTGAVEGSGRAFVAASDIVVMGTIYPAGRLLWQQPAYLFSVVNAEPDLKQDGKWGLHIVAKADAPQVRLDSPPPAEPRSGTGSETETGSL
ncbi:MAG: hypothetical protein H0W83_12320 [Planctomycetes bacterium]|nr:hypothetical protein [Planctomycetota bacterium]